MSWLDRYRGCVPPLIMTLMLLSIGLFCCRPGAQAQTAGDAGLPFRPGEKQLYELRWGVIPAGFAELEVLPLTALGGVPAYHFRLVIRTNEFVDVIYKVRDKIDSFADLSLQKSLYYRKSQREGRHVREEEVRFDGDKDYATYSNSGEVSAPVSLMAGTIDPLTAVFFVRSQPMREGLEILRPVTDGKKNVIGVARVLSRESLVVNGVVYDTFRIEPDLQDVGGVFKKSDKSRITLWFTADARHRLVKIAGKVVVGSFTGTICDQPGGAMPLTD